MSAGEFLTPREVAAMLKVSVRTIYRYVKMGKLRCIKLPSGRIRFERDALMRELEAWGELYAAKRFKATRLIAIRS
ncbi:MAG: helix-turn-helix domain-containing protein [Nitrososphaerota archaeon]